MAGRRGQGDVASPPLAAYRHTVCGKVTRLSDEVARQFAVLASDTLYCSFERGWRDAKEYVWVDDGQPVAS